MKPNINNFDKKTEESNAGARHPQPSDNIKKWSGFNALSGWFFELFLEDSNVGDQEDEKRYERQKGTVNALSSLLVVGFWAAVTVFVFDLVWGSLDKDGVADLGPFGDFFAGVINPIFTFLTFFGLVVTIVLQRAELGATLTELKLTRKEMQQANESFKSQAKASTAQVELAKQQQFENTFFSLLEQHNKTLNDVLLIEKTQIHSMNRPEGSVDWLYSYGYARRISNVDAEREANGMSSSHWISIKSSNESVDVVKRRFIARRCHDLEAMERVPVFIQTLISVFYTTRNIENSHVELKKVNEHVAPYFRVLYQLLKFIYESHQQEGDRFFHGFIISDSRSSNEKRYSNMVRSYIPDDALKILAVNCSKYPNGDQFLEFKALVQRYEFFEHMTLTVDNKYHPSLVGAIDEYTVKAFGKSQYIEHLVSNIKCGNVSGSSFYGDKVPVVSFIKNMSVRTEDLCSDPVETSQVITDC